MAPAAKNSAQKLDDSFDLLLQVDVAELVARNFGQAKLNIGYVNQNKRLVTALTSADHGLLNRVRPLHVVFENACSSTLKRESL